LRALDGPPSEAKEMDLAPDSKAPDFEQALAELEGLVERLEHGDLPLDEALKAFERGVALTRQCQASLQAAQQKVEILLKRGARAEIQPFEESADEAAAGPAAPE
jgi:exodeoxyribonuclease VII small subunit